MGFTGVRTSFVIPLSIPKYFPPPYTSPHKRVPTFVGHFFAMGVQRVRQRQPPTRRVVLRNYGVQAKRSQQRPVSADIF